jgi:hypothetical protein
VTPKATAQLRQKLCIQQRVASGQRVLHGLMGFAEADGLRAADGCTAWLLGLPLFSVTHGIGYVAWSLLAWRQAPSPDQRILSLRCCLPETRRVAGREQIAPRQITGFRLNGQRLSGSSIWLASKELRSVGISSPTR